MKREREMSDSRREFCKSILLGGGLLLTASCLKPGVNGSGTPEPTLRPTVALKYPETVDEIGEFFDTFSDRGFTAEDAIAQLKITGKPVSTTNAQDSLDTYPTQNELIKSVEIDRYQGHLDQIHLVYSRPIKVAFEDLKSRITPHYAAPPPGSVGSLSAPHILGTSIYAANIPNPVQTEGTPSNGRQVYSFPASGRVYIGRVTVSAEDDGSGSSLTGTKTVWEIGFYR